jgi:asparagine synthase (glutamine-hydrolysing)
MRDVRFLRARPPQQPLFHRDLEPYLHKAVETYARTSSGHPLTFSAFKEAPWYHVNRLAVEQSQVTMRSPYLDNDLVGLLYRASPEVRASEATAPRLPWYYGGPPINNTQTRSAICCMNPRM